jgi:putative addiction module killer protein
MIELRRYTTDDGKDVFGDWLRKLKDRCARAIIETRLTRVALGNFGDCKTVGSGVWELRVDVGPGYRVYYSREGKTVVLLLCGGDKRTQTRDIDRAIEFWTDYQQRKMP